LIKIGTIKTCQKKGSQNGFFFAPLRKFYGTFDFLDAVKASKMEVGEVEGY
jgi:hypothetical protein